MEVRIVGKSDLNQVDGGWLEAEKSAHLHGRQVQNGRQSSSDDVQVAEEPCQKCLQKGR
jgi:hypothetical protein